MQRCCVSAFRIHYSRFPTEVVRSDNARTRVNASPNATRHTIPHSSIITTTFRDINVDVSRYIIRPVVFFKDGAESIPSSFTQQTLIMSTVEDRSNIAAGHKANLSNPNTSEESKENSRKELEKLGGEDAFYDKKGEDAPAAGMGGQGNVLGGHKATLSNPNTSEEAKENSRKILEQHGEQV
ncbi:Conidiation-specific protein 6 [Pseudocercospora fuligena]|uniref:Conidiation-specific protein 6 n=1 Tax=Pseudocercospora fuligena TaxID=685502 RepID=A0A8H6RNH5_9PEZI|nr:Conidiation-specific protein 6 [Pseudocercospora fuligena]